MTGHVLHIHAGLPKTGTSALQAYLALNRDLLAGAGLSQMETGRDAAGHHHALFQVLGGPLPGPRRRLAAALAREVRASAGVPLVSSEYALLAAAYGWGAQGFAALRAEGLRLRFYLVLRDPVAFAVSAYPEFLRNLLMPQPFEAFVRRQVLPLLADRAGLVARLSRFGAVVVLDYDGAPVWPALLDAVGIAPPDGAADPGVVNPSLGAAGTAALFDTLTSFAPRIRRWNARMHLRPHVMACTQNFPGEDVPFAPVTPEVAALIRAQAAWRGCEGPVGPGPRPDPALQARCSALLGEVLERQLAVLARRKLTLRRVAGAPLDHVADRMIRRRVMGC